MLSRILATLAVSSCVLTGTAHCAEAQEKKPNFVIIWGDDIGITDVSAYSKGLMGFHTQNIDSIANQNDLHRLLRGTELHRGTLDLHHRPDRDSHWPQQSWHSSCS
jgi:hypothetical protein